MNKPLAQPDYRACAALAPRPAPLAPMGGTQAHIAMLRFVTGWIEAKGCSPSYREIAAGMNISSLSEVHRMLSGLRARGMMTQIAGDKQSLPRSLEPRRPISLPRAPDGAPLFAVAHDALDAQFAALRAQSPRGRPQRRASKGSRRRG